MQPSTVLAVLATAVMTSAAPNQKPSPQAHKKSTSGNICGQNQEQACCNSANGLAVLGLGCTLSSVLDGACDGIVQCCDVDQNGEIKLGNLCVPIQL